MNLLGISMVGIKKGLEWGAAGASRVAPRNYKGTTCTYMEEEHTAIHGFLIYTRVRTRNVLGK
jgi:hypothetical protein